MICLNDFTLKDLHRLSLESVMYSPKVNNGQGEEIKTKRLQSFAVVDNYGQISFQDFAASLQKSVPEDQIFMRYRRQMFPALVFSPVRVITDGLFTRLAEDKELMQIAVVDIEDNQRSLTDLRIDLKMLYRQWAEYIQGVINASITVSSGDVPSSWQNKGYLDSAVADGNNPITGYSENYVLTKRLQSQLKADNLSLNTTYWIGGGKYHAVFREVTLHTSEEYIPTVWNFKKFDNAALR